MNRVTHSAEGRPRLQVRQAQLTYYLIINKHLKRVNKSSRAFPDLEIQIWRTYHGFSGWRFELRIVGDFFRGLSKGCHVGRFDSCFWPHWERFVVLWHADQWFSHREFRQTSKTRRYCRYLPADRRSGSSRTSAVTRRVG